MANVLVRNLKPQTVKLLKKRAADNGRSLQAELVAILEDAAGAADIDTLALIRRVREQLKDWKQTTDNVDLLLEDRDR